MRRASSIFTPNRQRSRLDNGEPQTSGPIGFATFQFLCLSVRVCVRVGLRGFFSLGLSRGMNLTEFAFNQEEDFCMKRKKSQNCDLSVASLMLRGSLKQPNLFAK